MDDEYISKKRAVDLLSTLINPHDLLSIHTIGMAIHFIENEPSADVQPVKHGRWIDCTFYDPCEKSWEQDFEFECNNCGHKIYHKPNDDNLFCCHCSAKMDLKEGEHGEN